MSTRELIEAVREPEQFMGAPVVNGVRVPSACIRAIDYDALRAACRAVLDKLITECEAEFMLDGMWNDDGQAVSLRTITDARALRGKL